MVASYNIGMIMAAVNSGPDSKPFRPWPVQSSEANSTSTSKTSSPAAPKTAQSTVPEKEVRYSTDSESILKDAPVQSKKSHRSGLLKKLARRN